MPKVEKCTEKQLRNIIRDLGGTSLALEAMAELQRRGLPIVK